MANQRNIADGPWQFEPHAGYGHKDEDGNPFPFGYLSASPTPVPIFGLHVFLGHPHEQLLAVARKISAAPDMLAALRLVCDAVERPPAPNCSCFIMPPCGDCFEYSALREMFDAVDAAIAKAEAATTASPD